MRGVLDLLARMLRQGAKLVDIFLVAYFSVAAFCGIFLLVEACAHPPGDPFAIKVPSTLHAVCLVLEDSDGRRYKHTAWFNDAGYKLALLWPDSKDGLCK